MGISDEDVMVLAARVRSTVGDQLPAWPGGWPGQVELALIDAIFSIRARYGQPGTEGRPSTGVLAVVERWSEHRGGPADDLLRLREMDIQRLTHILSNKAKSGGRTKAAVVVDAASRLSEVGLRHASDFTGSAEQKAAYIGVPGCGGITWAYFGMLLGQPNSKPDTWVQRYIRGSVRSDISTEDCRRLVNSTARHLDVDATRLDHAIWLYARGRL
ncbi:hypothetical protein [Phycicoccus avicenniae]|uniref:hypothetical protein n=1 Tax=Phycicoccus avicenniae TaxID=2828860 RepID=UPI003D2D6C10